ncbi:MAG: hypothetical protein AAB462_04175 [Patescibacteria group bacterium]
MSGEEDSWAIADYDPLLNLQCEQAQRQQAARSEQPSAPENVKHPSAAWLAPITVGYIAALFVLTPQLVKIGTNDKNPVRSEDDALITNEISCQYLKPSLISAARKVVKFVAKYPDASEKSVRRNKIITEVSGQADGDEGKMRLVTRRHGDSDKVDPNSTLSLGVVHESDDRAGNRQLESVLLAAPSGETSLTRPYGRTNVWFASERKQYTSAGSNIMDDRRSSTNGDSSLIASNSQSILGDAMFAIKFDYKLSTANPKDQDHSCNQLAEIPRS